MKVIFKGEEIEVEETEVLKAVKDEYDTKTATLEKQLVDEQTKNEENLKKLREEHAKQLRVILSTGKYEDKTEEEKEEEQERSKIDESIKRIVKRFQ